MSIEPLIVYMGSGKNPTKWVEFGVDYPDYPGTKHEESLPGKWDWQWSVRPKDFALPSLNLTRNGDHPPGYPVSQI